MSPVDKAKTIIKRVEQVGGTPNAAARFLDINFTPRTRELVYELEPDIGKYKYAFKKFGAWLTLPTELAATNAEQKVNCICTKCSQHFVVDLRALISGRSTCCHTCSLKNRSNLSVVGDNGVIFKSIKSFANEIGLADKYQSIRHQLIKGQSISHQTINYQLAQ